MIKLLKKFYRNTYKRAFSKIDVVLDDETRGMQSLLDVGCGFNSPIRDFSKRMHTVGIDAFERSIEESKKRNIHNEYRVMNVLEMEKAFGPKSFDCVIAMDVIEHQDKKNGLEMMRQMEHLAAKKVIIYTPNGFLEQGDRFDNPWQVHYSGWTTEEFEKMGYRVIGINGWKPLRGEYSRPKYPPKILWGFVSDLTELFVRSKPEKAFQLLAIKEMP